CIIIHNEGHFFFLSVSPPDSRFFLNPSDCLRIFLQFPVFVLSLMPFYFLVICLIPSPRDKKFSDSSLSLWSCCINSFFEENLFSSRSLFRKLIFTFSPYILRLKSNMLTSISFIIPSASVGL